MKRYVLTVMIVLAAIVSLGAADTMSIQVDSAQLRGRPSFVGPVAAELSYGDLVDVLDESRGWMQVRTSEGTTGWIQGSALTDKKIRLSSGGNVSSGASSDEVALAGKGFNAEVEQEYKSETDLDFTWVDEMEGWEVSTDELVIFLEEGELRGVIQ